MSDTGWLVYARVDSRGHLPKFCSYADTAPTFESAAKSVKGGATLQKHSFWQNEILHKVGIKKIKKSLRRVMLVGLSGLEPPTPTFESAAKSVKGGATLQKRSFWQNEILHKVGIKKTKNHSEE